MLEQFTTGFNGDGTTELMEFGLVCLVGVTIVVAWCAWYMRQD